MAPPAPRRSARLAWTTAALLGAGAAAGVPAAPGVGVKELLLGSARSGHLRRRFEEAADAARLDSTATGAVRRLQTDMEDGVVCPIVMLGLAPPPALQNYRACFQAKMEQNSSHDWSVPGAELAAKADCWCSNSLTDTIESFGCCDHADLFPMCSLDCSADCDGTLAQTCIQECPSMCFEAGEYAIDPDLCNSCDWTKCWPVLRCMTSHAESRVEAGELNKTCHEIDFGEAPALQEYWTCWRDAPKHSSHWNLLSSMAHCICREGMIDAVRQHSCCDSQLYGGGVCDIQCSTESECNTQQAQTCIHSCQRRCPSHNAIDQECLDICLKNDAPCRKYASCRPPMLALHVCDDGRWPEAASGCCTMNRTDGGPGTVYTCPSLCESSQVFRLDGGRSIPWWSRWQPNHGMVLQCSCRDCPQTTEEGLMKLERTIEHSIWDNGQMMLVDIARREGLQYGPNRRMQELMAQRNQQIRAVIEDRRVQGIYADSRIAEINDQFTIAIEEAARTFGDDPPVAPDEGSPGDYSSRRRRDGSSQRRGPGRDDGPSMAATLVITCICTFSFVSAIILATCCIVKRRRRPSLVEFQSTQVVIGNPVASPPNSGLADGVACGGTKAAWGGDSATGAGGSAGSGETQAAVAVAPVRPKSASSGERASE